MMEAEKTEKTEIFIHEYTDKLMKCLFPKKRLFLNKIMY